MSTDNPTGRDSRNAELIAGLREAADWFERHPGLPDFNAYIGSTVYGPSARVELTALASALEDRAHEEVMGSIVYVKGQFGPKVVVSGSTNSQHLGAAPAPSYRPIIGERAA